eukprot:CAMPEP_0180505924 /NCGR_PEP_ID=MMETSP1036_2-20121128/47651_1 /TAXON_ID=632150 /ORGANISM="Azadinium spinosum, Strain 3D9" /LENGTH=121 /DNA_ID=CAMNT_0022515703 /DNA_START=282 /DNA_END=644 /DNA_ORIENTATION=+
MHMAALLMGEEPSHEEDRIEAIDDHSMAVAGRPRRVFTHMDPSARDLTLRRVRDGPDVIEVLGTVMTTENYQNVLRGDHSGMSMSGAPRGFAHGVPDVASLAVPPIVIEARHPTEASQHKH